jgi:GNAT superfamily N-acetyltransferase
VEYYLGRPEPTPAEYEEPEHEHGTGRLEFQCPACNMPVVDESGNFFRGLLMCPRCMKFLEETQNVGIPLDDGVHRLVPEEVDWRAIHDVFLKAHDDYTAFFVLGPLDDWREGRLRIYAAVHEGVIVGFSTWNELAWNYERVCLRGLWVQPNHRRRGLASALVSKEGENLGGFSIESPNPDCISVLEKLGYIDKKDMTGF